MRLLPLLLLPLLAIFGGSSPSTSKACEGITRSGESFINATQAYECLISTPFRQAIAHNMIKYYNDTLQFQSTLAYLANPPPTYQQPPVDLLAGLNDLQRKVETKAFADEYSFEIALYRLLHAAHDDHLKFQGGVLGVFLFFSPVDIVSLSLDGQELPKVYVTEDFFPREKEDKPWRPSAIKAINGRDVNQYLSEFATNNSYGKLEPHADWNLLFRSAALDNQGYFDMFAGGFKVYPGPSIEFTFENGSVYGPVPWNATYINGGNTGPLATGGDFYNRFVLGMLPASIGQEEKSAPSVSPSSALAPALPPPVPKAYPRANLTMRGIHGNTGGILRGYFLQESELAVLSIPSFSYTLEDTKEFRKTVINFLRGSRAAGVQKLVIDLQQNTGGKSLLAIETFKLFFPHHDPSATSRRRAHPMADVLGSTITNYWNDFRKTPELYKKLSINEWAVSSRLDATTGENFTSWGDFFGPAGGYHGDNYTKLEEYNLSNPVFDKEAAGLVIDNGEGPETFYKAKDIILLTDGLCSSTCALFVEMMHHRASVRTVVAGGQPTYGPMQAVGGTRGATSYSLEDMEVDIEMAVTIDNATAPNLPDATKNSFFIPYASVNLRDQVRHDDETSTPLQFHYQQADCRIFYTPETFYNMTELWRYAARAWWHDRSMCVHNSTIEGAAPEKLPQSAPPTLDKRFDTPYWEEQSEELLDVMDNTKIELLDSGDIRGRIHGQPCGNAGHCNGGANYQCVEVTRTCYFGSNSTQNACLLPCDASANNACGDRYCILDEVHHSRVGERHLWRTGFCWPDRFPSCPEDVHDEDGDLVLPDYEEDDYDMLTVRRMET